MTNIKKRKLKLSNKGWAVLGILVFATIVIFYFQSYTFIDAKDAKITFNDKVNYEVEMDRVTIYIPINANTVEYKMWLGEKYFEKDQTIASQLLASLDTSIPNEVVTTVLVDRVPLTLSFIVE